MPASPATKQPPNQPGPPLPPFHPCAQWHASNRRRRRAPAPQVSLTTPRVADKGRLAAFRKLTGWGGGGGGAAAPGQLPMMFLMAEGFKLVMSVLTLPAFPVSILGTVVNKKARYSLLRGVAEGERLLYRCGARGATRRCTRGGGSGCGRALVAGACRGGGAGQRRPPQDVATN